jgi:hypothetical protein
MRWLLFWALLVFLVSWVAVTILALILKDPSLAQRAGAIGIASAITLFGYQRERIADILDATDAEKLEIIDHTSALRGYQFQLELWDSLSGLGVSKENPAEQMTKNVRSLSSISNQIESLTDQTTAMKSKLAQSLRELGSLESRAKTLRREIATLEIIAVALATIQTGFGDSIVRLLIGV